MEKRNIIQKLLGVFKTEQRSISDGPTTSVGLPYGFSTSPLSVQSSMQLSAVYRCVEVISDSIASQSWIVNEYTSDKGWMSNEFNDLHYILNIEPNKTMSRYSFMKTLIAKVLLEGNGYVVIKRNDRGDAESLELVTDSVDMFKRKDGTVYYAIDRKGRTEKVDGEDMIHILNFTYNGLTGVSTLYHAANAMGLSLAAENSAKGFFLGGANMSGILTAEGKLTQDKADAIKSSWSSAFNVTAGVPGGIAVMEKGLEFKPVTINPKDAQMLETRQYNVIEICRFFGVPPMKVFDNSNLTYSNVEAYQLGFITDTISPLDEKIEAEFNRKLFRPSLKRVTRVQLDINNLLRANLDARANYLSKMWGVGGLTINELRSEIGQPEIEGGDEVFLPVNMLPLSKHNKTVNKNEK